MNIQSRWKVFTIIYRPTPLLAHFVRHYAALGFTDIVIAASDLCRDIDWLAIRAAAGEATVHVEQLYHGVFDNGRDTGVLNGLKARYVEDRHEWSAQTDLDEFYEYPLSLAELAATAGDANCVQGFFVDRIAADGALPPIRDDIPIAEQFPVETRITKRILGGCDRKLTRTLILAQSKYTADALGEWIKLCGDDAPDEADPKRIVFEKFWRSGDSAEPLQTASQILSATNPMEVG